jgi:hypothetical protein
MAKSNIAKKIANELDNEYAKLQSAVAPDMHRRARSRLGRVKRALNRMKPLKLKAHKASAIEREVKAKLAGVRRQIDLAKRKNAANKSRLASLKREKLWLEREIPRLNVAIRSLSSAEKKWARKHGSAWKVMVALEKRVSREEKRKEKAVKALQKYFK